VEKGERELIDMVNELIDIAVEAEEMKSFHLLYYATSITDF